MLAEIDNFFVINGFKSVSKSIRYTLAAHLITCPVWLPFLLYICCGPKKTKSKKEKKTKDG